MGIWALLMLDAVVGPAYPSRPVYFLTLIN